MGNKSSSRPEDLVAGGSRHHQIFPRLNEKQFAVLERYGERRRLKAGDVLFTEGDRHIPMFTIVSGTIEASRGAGDKHHVLGTHGPGSFTGEVGTLAGRGAVATARATSDCEVIVIDEESLRALVVAEAELSETIMRAYILRRVAFIQDQHGGTLVIGSSASWSTLVLRHFLSRNAQPFAYFDIVEHEEAKGLLERYDATEADIPVIVTLQGNVLKQPTNRAVADAIGLSPDRLNGERFDVVVVGAGPGGLAAAVYAASEGLRVAVVDTKAPGGQAGTSSKIENYFGFPTGISGQALAGRGLSQCRKFGAEVGVPIEVLGIECENAPPFHLRLNYDEHVYANAVVIATGARYRKPQLPRLEEFEGSGIYYSATYMEAAFCNNQELIIVGGGNSAGQAAVFLSGFARHVHIVIRGDGLSASMSNYLIRRIEAAANISVHVRTQIVELNGETQLESIKWDSQGHIEEKPIRHVFLFLGAQPSTGWLGDCVALDKHGFVLTGPDAMPQWSSDRPPHYLETSRQGIFAVGDVRSGSVKRVAAAVGEGAAAIQSLHQYLALNR
ncbi:FAD-dependent oxidoreductase [Paraburkholderia phytofirmans]|uniref:Cyclic nucleotide-regulated FAD-dependent pyridine nucleotide-disulphide oxidoreductase n=1 Tax=Paraburkholderia phytofirmans (strain DSM 17436 / LMG 22146 / PsJN) TaxID=398527 RepID=B2TD64_PARPJ|nr:cyclic nucleotide-binding domain-containing thioredoxin-disulfide reductase [Paraburkholderia phytofirmans]ACD18978.1 cyclic nucleotide-regulated FAD-dependent pyridine nucleotide-disulphide oxidoreductase [Paraburkholderia phytofirmans PsJN]